MENQLASSSVNTTWLGSFLHEELRLILFITEQCNLRCVYCYEDFKLGKIENFVLDGVKNLIQSRAKELKRLHLSFFGGEPLLNKKSVIELSSWAKNLCAENEISYFGHITTNGYSLDKKTFDELINSGVNVFQITLDGEKEAHDRLRPTVNGKSTFTKILNNLIEMANSKAEFFCTVRFNIADSNFFSVKQFILNHSQHFSKDKRFSLHFHPIFGMLELTLTKNEQVTHLKELAKTYNLFFDEAEEGAYVCYAARADSYVIRANGIIQKCTVATNSEINNVGKIFHDGTLELDQEKLRKWVFAQDKSCPVQSLKLENLLTPYEDAGKYVSQNVSSLPD